MWNGGRLSLGCYSSRPSECLGLFLGILAEGTNWPAVRLASYVSQEKKKSPPGVQSSGPRCLATVLPVA